MTSGVKRDKCIKNISKDIKIYPNYYNYNYKTKNKIINKTNIYDNINKKYNSIICSTSNQKKSGIIDFKNNLPEIYDKYSDILNNYKDVGKSNMTREEFCMIIEIILRLNNNENVKYQYNYDEYMLKIYDF